MFSTDSFILLIGLKVIYWIKWASEITISVEMSVRFVAHCYLFACGSRHCSVITDMKQVPLWKCKLKDVFFCVCVCVWLQLFKLLRGKSQRSNCKYSFKYLRVCVWVPNLVRFSNLLLLAFVDPDFNFEFKVHFN